MMLSSRWLFKLISSPIKTIGETKRLDRLMIKNWCQAITQLDRIYWYDPLARYKKLFRTSQTISISIQPSNISQSLEILGFLPWFQLLSHHQLWNVTNCTVKSSLYSFISRLVNFSAVKACDKFSFLWKRRAYGLH